MGGRQKWIRPEEEEAGSYLRVGRTKSRAQEASRWGPGRGRGATHVGREVASLGTQGTRVSPNGPGARDVGSP